MSSVTAKKKNIPIHAFMKTASGGSEIFGRISAEIAKKIRREAAPIKLQHGDARFGAVHIEQSHGAEIRRAGYKSIEAFIADVAKNYSEIRQGEGSRLLLVKKNEGLKVNIIELRPHKDGSFYGITTGGVYREKYFANYKALWERRATPSSAGPEPSGTLSGSARGKARAGKAIRMGQSTSKSSLTREGKKNNMAKKNPIPKGALKSREGKRRRNPADPIPSMVEIYAQALETHAVKGSSSLFPGQEFVHEWEKAGTKIFGLPAGTIISLPDGDSYTLNTRTVLMQNKGSDLWDLFRQ